MLIDFFIFLIKKAQRSFFWTDLSKTYAGYLLGAQKPLQKKNLDEKKRWVYPLPDVVLSPIIS
jgi:hypothetical protein